MNYYNSKRKHITYLRKKYLRKVGEDYNNREDDKNNHNENASYSDIGHRGIWDEGSSENDYLWWWLPGWKSVRVAPSRISPDRSLPLSEQVTTHSREIMKDPDVDFAQLRYYWRGRWESDTRRLSIYNSLSGNRPIPRYLLELLEKRFPNYILYTAKSLDKVRKKYLKKADPNRPNPTSFGGEGATTKDPWYRRLMHVFGLGKKPKKENPQAGKPNQEQPTQPQQGQPQEESQQNTLTAPKQQQPPQTQPAAEEATTGQPTAPTGQEQPEQPPTAAPEETGEALPEGAEGAPAPDIGEIPGGEPLPELPGELEEEDYQEGRGKHGPKIIPDITDREWIDSGRWATVDSSHVGAIKYDKDSQTLYVRFVGRRTRKKPASYSEYEYDGVSEQTAVQCFRAPSVGKFVWSHLRGQYGYRRVKALRYKYGMGSILDAIKVLGKKVLLQVPNSPVLFKRISPYPASRSIKSLRLKYSKKAYPHPLDVMIGAIIQNPLNTGVWGILADWLEQRGDPRYQQVREAAVNIETNRLPIIEGYLEGLFYERYLRARGIALRRRNREYWQNFDEAYQQVPENVRNMEYNQRMDHEDIGAFSNLVSQERDRTIDEFKRRSYTAAAGQYIQQLFEKESNQG